MVTQSSFSIKAMRRQQSCYKSSYLKAGCVFYHHSLLLHPLSSPKYGSVGHLAQHHDSWSGHTTPGTLTTPLRAHLSTPVLAAHIHTWLDILVPQLLLNTSQTRFLGSASLYPDCFVSKIVRTTSHPRYPHKSWSVPQQPWLKVPFLLWWKLSNSVIQHFFTADAGSISSSWPRQWVP